jgi:hypothetical protein
VIINNNNKWKPADRAIDGHWTMMMTVGDKYKAVDRDQNKQATLYNY